MKRLFFTMVVMMGILCVGCSKEDEDAKSANISSSDPEGTVVVNMRNDGENWIDIGIGNEIRINSANNFEGRYSGQQQFVSVGKVSGLSAIKSIPSTGWASTVGVVPGTGYLAYDSWGHEVARIYVVEQMEGVSGGIIGATIKYHHPIETAIQLENTSIEIGGGAYRWGSYQGEEFTVSLKAPTSYEVESKPNWIGSVECYTRYVKLWTEYNGSGSPRTGNIVLKNSMNSVTLSVTQLPASDNIY